MLCSMLMMAVFKDNHRYLKSPCSQSELSQILNNLFGDFETTEHGHVWTDAGSGASYCILDVSSKEALLT